MDPSNLRSQSSSYVGLLHSQQDFSGFQFTTISRRTSGDTSFVDVESRPEGVKAAKAKRNTGKGKSVAEIATIWEMKKDDLVRKERLSRLAILDTLLGKTQPFSEAEDVVKNKLLADSGFLKWVK
ncbi:hypothetical protein YC2023_114803 [Brassica napus]